MRANVITAVSSNNNAFDIAIEKAGTTDREVRYDVIAVDVKDAIITSRANGAQFRLATMAAATQGRSVADVSHAELANFALGHSGFVRGYRYTSLQAYLFGDSLSVTRVSPRLVAALGFTPTVATKI